MSHLRVFSVEQFSFVLISLVIVAQMSQYRDMSDAAWYSTAHSAIHTAYPDHPLKRRLIMFSLSLLLKKGKLHSTVTSWWLQRIHTLQLT